MAIPFTEMVNTGEIADLKGNEFSSEMLKLRFFWFSQKVASGAGAWTSRGRELLQIHLPDSFLNISSLICPKLAPCIFSIMCFSTLSLPHLPVEDKNYTATEAEPQIIPKTSLTFYHSTTLPAHHSSLSSLIEYI